MAEPTTYTTWPTAIDLTRLLSADQLLSDTDIAAGKFDFASYINAAINDFERDTAWYPYLKDTADVTRIYDSPGPPQDSGQFVSRQGGARLLYLDNGLITLTSLTVGKSSTNSGTALVLGQDFYLEGINASLANYPYMRVRFMVNQFGLPQSVYIVGKWGRTATIEARVWNCVRARAKSLFVSDLSSYGQPVEVKIGNDTFKWDPQALTKKAQSDQDNYKKVVMQEKRVVI